MQLQYVPHRTDAYVLRLKKKRHFVAPVFFLATTVHICDLSRDSMQLSE